MIKILHYNDMIYNDNKQENKYKQIFDDGGG